MKLKTILLASLCVGLLSSCVSRRVYNELDEQYKAALAENDALSNDLDILNSSNNDLEKIKRDLANQLKSLQEEREALNAKIVAAQQKLKDLETSYSNLEKFNEESLKNEAIRLAKATAELEEKSKRVDELEDILLANERQMKALKESLSSALNAFEGRGLTIEQKNGRVYVSMENKLLFKSGSWSVNDEGRKAIQELGNVLADNQDISVVIEGHTDNDKILGNLGDGVKTNWDLSAKRALSIVDILSANPAVNKRNLTAAGRSEYVPLAPNNTDEGKMKNRRIEVILTPNLDNINAVLNEL